MMTSSGDNNWPSGSFGLLTYKTKKLKKNKPKAEKETAQPTAARFKKKINRTQSKKPHSLRLRGLIK